MSGYLGYTFASQRPATLQDELTRLSSAPANSNSGLNEQYGSLGDFKKAIEELRAALPEADVVSTDEDVLEEHGNSVNDYHPGALSTFV